MFSKLVLLFTIVACAHSSPEWLIRNGLSPQVLSTGISSGSRTQDGIGNYAFNYGIANEVGATNSRAESGDAAGNKIGSYTLTDIDGRARRVDYVADSLGFRASVRTNEPGTAMSAPADAAVVSPYAMPVAPAPIAAAPALAAAPIAALPALSSAPIAAATIGAAPVLAATPIAALPALAATPVPAYSTAIRHGAAIVSPYGLGLY